MPAAEASREFLWHAVIDTVVPESSNIDIRSALTSALQAGDEVEELLSLLSAIPQRSLVFYGKRKNELAGPTMLSAACSLNSYVTFLSQMKLSPRISFCDWRMWRKNFLETISIA